MVQQPVEGRIGGQVEVTGGGRRGISHRGINRWSKNTPIIARGVGLGLAIATVSLGCTAPNPSTSAETPTAGTPTAAVPDRLCAYDPDLGPNPLGMRAYITLSEADGNTTVTFDQFPSPVGNDANQPVTLASTRELTFYDLDLDATRELLLSNPDYYTELVNYPDPDGFGPVNAVMSCS